MYSLAMEYDNDDSFMIEMEDDSNNKSIISPTDHIDTWQLNVAQGGVLIATPKNDPDQYN